MNWGPQPASVAIDIGAMKLRSWLTLAQVDTVHEQLTWVVDQTGVAPDYLIGAVNAGRSDLTRSVGWTWKFAVGGGGDGQIVFPTLPTDIFDFNFRDTDSTNVSGLDGIASPGGYDAARATAINTPVHHQRQLARAHDDVGHGGHRSPGGRGDRRRCAPGGDAACLILDDSGAGDPAPPC